MSKINWDKPIEFMISMGKWVPARLVVSDIKSENLNSDQYTHGVLFENTSIYASNLEIFYRCDVNGSYGGITKIRNVVKKTTLYGSVFKNGSIANGGFHSSPTLYSTRKEAEEAPVPYGYSFSGTFKTEVIEDVGA